MNIQCKKCLEFKSVTDFNKDKYTKNGLKGACKGCCHKQYMLNKDHILKKQKENKNKDIECYRKKALERYYKNHEKNKKIRQKSYHKIKDKLKITRKKYREQNRKEIRAKGREYYKQNKEKIIKKNVTYNRFKSNTDIKFKIKNYLRTRLYSAIKGKLKSGSAVKDLGCSVEELKAYLESKFQEGMSWDNYGFYGWHIDHIMPLSSFDLTDPEQFKKACHYTNLQPLWAEDNLSKGSKLDYELQTS